MNRRSLLIFSSLAISPAILGAELPVRDGLALWLNASAQPEIRRTASLPPIGNLQPVDVALDGSGNSRQASQLIGDRRPIYQSDGEAAYWKFDGKDDFLAISGSRQLTPSATIFILAAPKANAGNFSALFGTAETGKNDYTSGLNLDFGPKSTNDVSVLNVESAGATGFRDLLEPGFFNATERPFGDFHVFTVRSKISKGGNEVFLDGFKGGARDRFESMIGLDQMVIGGRIYSNDATQPPQAGSLLNGAIAEVIIYQRALSDEERTKVEQYLQTKTIALNGLLRGAKGHALETVANPPVLQMLVPGFTVDELPLKIGNLTNVRYRHDGKLVGLGYDGRIHLLTDTNGDGLEDKAELFWDQTTMRGPIGIALLPKEDPRGDGVLVASKGKVSLFLDKNRDGKAEEEIVIATGWKVGFQAVDTIGLAVDPKDGSIYFGLGTQNFADPYVIDKNTGRSLYDIKSTHGTIQRLSADYSKRETVCTGVRFTCALAFNREGDLFASEQEGATWLSNGNPMDELLHIETGKHYGFPPRHPKYLPDVRDEPPVSEYGPQHQSTVGMVFNEGVNGGPHFGPAHWAGDALVCGESRGKIWRTKLAKTPLGYVAQNHLIACLNLLTVDACVSPQGNLVVACHTGPPDWGTGPAGEGRIFRVRYSGQSLPQPVTAWASGPDEFRIAFDRPLEPKDWATAQKEVKVEAGEFVSAGDRFETVRPGYQVVRDQMASPRRWVDILGLTLSEDRRTMGLRVARQSEPVSYAISLPLPATWKQSGGIAQHAQIDLQATLNGVAATLATKDGQSRQTILPHASLAASEMLTAGSTEHAAFLKAAKTPGATLTLRGKCDSSNPFNPAVQPGSKLDWDITKDPVASETYSVHTDYGQAKQVSLKSTPAEKLQGFEITAMLGSAEKANGLFIARGEVRRPLSTGRFFTPWTVEKSAQPKGKDAQIVRTDVKGSWMKGRTLFFGEATCFTCHTMRGEGMAFGPDLTNLIHRDRDSVVHDILQPSATINPDQSGSEVKLKDGTSFNAIVRTMTKDKVVIGLPGGAQNEFPRDQVISTEPLKTSLMPEDFRKRLTPEQMEDLLTYLLVNPLEPAPIARTEPPIPPARKMEEVRQVLATAKSSAPAQALKILLVAGPKDHGPDEHDYPLWLDRWSKLLALGEKVTVTTSMGFPSAEQLRAADVAVFYNANPGWNESHAALLDEYHKRGGGAVYIHYAVDGGKTPDAVAERMGLAFTFGSKFRHGDFDLVFTKPDHPITRGFSKLRFTDETYWSMRGDKSRLSVLATAVEDAVPQPELWTMERHQSRIVGCIPGHYTWTFDDPLFRVLVLRSISWAAKLPDADRLSDLATIGARVQGP
jgi:putative heme-binding domain-containing protein